jgi:hypothetical protein
MQVSFMEPNQFGMHKALPHEDALREHGPGSEELTHTKH